MDALPFNLTDLVVLAVLVISGLLALSRGLAREVLSVASWVGALLVAFYGFDQAKPFARRLVQPDLLADLAAGVGLFLATFIVLSLITRYIASHVQESALGAVDRTLGFLFGLLRGAVLISLAYLLIAWLVPREDQPDWLRQARSLPLIESGAELLLSLVPTRDKEAEEGAAGRERAERRAAESERLFRSLAAPQPREEPSGPGGIGYDAAQRAEMERLLESTRPAAGGAEEETAR